MVNSLKVKFSRDLHLQYADFTGIDAFEVRRGGAEPPILFLPDGVGMMIHLGSTPDVGFRERESTCTKNAAPCVSGFSG